MKIGEKIKELRKKHSITQEQLAENLGVSFQAVSKWENEIAFPDITLIPALARFFNVTTDYLFDYAPLPPIKLKIITPEKYEDVNEIIKLIRDDKTVIVNCENIDKEIAQQMKDKIISDIVDLFIHPISDVSYSLIFQRRKCK